MITHVHGHGFFLTKREVTGSLVERTEKIKGGFILLAKLLTQHEIWQKPPLFLKLWVWMLRQASFKDHGDLKRGQFFTTLDSIRHEMGHKVGFRRVKPSKKVIRTALEYLKERSMIVCLFR